MKKISFLTTAFLILISVIGNAQDKYFTKEGTAKFFSKAPLEQIEGINKKVTSVLEITTGKLEFSVLMKAFEFQKALMQEHFNENYVESDKFPKAVFKGTVENPEQVKWTTNGTYPVKVTGKMTIHGVTKDITVPGTFEVKDGIINGTSTFNILVKDYDIAIPNLVKDKISESVKVDVDLKYEPFTSK